MRWHALVLLALLVGLGRAQEPPLGALLLAFTRADHADVRLYDVQAEATRRLRLGDGLHHVWGFSPDGCRLLASLDAGRLGGRLFSLGLDGTDVRPLVHFDELPPQAWGVWEAAWSPDGQRIAFVMLREQAERGQVVIARHLAIIPAEGGAPQFISVTGREHSPAWSPDGALLAYTSYDERPAGADPLSTAAPTSIPVSYTHLRAHET
jgi:Tol biopolymer transport system component